MSLFLMGCSVLAGAFLCFLALMLLLNIFGLPGNWIMLGLVAVYYFLVPEHGGLTVGYWIIVLLIGILGELAEFGLQIVQARRFGSTGTCTVGGMVGAFAGAVLMAPLFFGLGALVGALAGAWTGCLAVELMRGRRSGSAVRAACGCMMGRFLGIVCKIACGGMMLAITCQYIWPDPQQLPFRFPWLPGPSLPAGDLEQVMGVVLSAAV